MGIAVGCDISFCFNVCEMPFLNFPPIGILYPFLAIYVTELLLS